MNDDTNDDLRRRIRALGNEMGPGMLAGTEAIFAPLAPRPAAGHCTIVRDLAYGPDSRHRLDLFRPVEDGGAGRPILVYVHGGGFVRGDKGGPDDPFYGNIGIWAARRDFIGAVITYRLAPAHRWPAGAEDVAAAVAWLRANAASHGGDPARVFVAGQSAGAAHVAGYAATPRLHGGRAPAGAIMLSGLYDVTRLADNASAQAYYGTDTSRYPGQSSLPGLITSDVPCLFTVAEYDPATFQEQAALVVQEWWAAKGEWPRMLYLPDGNHISAGLAIGSPHDRLSEEIAAFVRKFPEEAA